jgi:hypothetical protein
MGIKDIISQAKNKLTFKLNALTYDKDAEKVALQEKLTQQKAELETKASEKPGTATPADAKETLIVSIYNAYAEYVNEWQRRATASKQFPQAFINAFGFLTLGAKKYDKELQANPSKELFSRMIDELAAAIKSTYVQGGYKGDLNLLAIEIDKTKPSFPGSKSLLQKIHPPSKTAVQKFGASFFATLTGVLLTLALAFVCILAGSLAANDAIGRAPGVRLVYFVYAAIPFFTPIVLIYYIWRYWKGTYPIFYNMLPLTTHVSDYWIINTVLWPFFFYRDSNVDVQAEQFLRLGKALVWNAAPASNSNSNSNNNGASNGASNGANNAANNGASNGANNAANNGANNGASNAANNGSNNGSSLPKSGPKNEEQNEQVIDAVFNGKNNAESEPKPPSATDN